MPQTSKGANENQPWIQFMRHCAVEYHAQRAAAREAAAKDAHTAGNDVKKKVRKPATSTCAKAAKAAQPNVPRRVCEKQTDTARDIN